jgi:glycine cleavage system H protein
MEAAMQILEDRKYSREHVWVLTADAVATLGITDHAQDELGEITYLDLPDAGRDVHAGTSMGEIESIKTVSQFVAPVSGQVIERNQSAIDKPELVNSDPYGEGWLVKVQLDGAEQLDGLLSADEYRAQTEV